MPINTTAKYFGGFNNAERPLKPGVTVTDILVRGGGGTITFSDGVTVEYVFGFKPDPTIPAGGLFDVTLCGPRANLVYDNVVSQCVCDMVDWLMQCSSVNNRLSIIEAKMGLAKEFDIVAGDWIAGTANQIPILQTGTPAVGELGPHEFPLGSAYSISVFKNSGLPVITGVDVEYDIDLTTGTLTLRKSGLAPNFSGRVIIGSITCF